MRRTASIEYGLGDWRILPLFVAGPVRRENRRARPTSICADASHARPRPGRPSLSAQVDMEIEVHVRARTDKSCVAFLEYLKESGSGAAIRAAMLPISITTLEQSTRAAGSRKLGLA